jgi:Zn-dependent protease with chaperone function
MPSMSAGSSAAGPFAGTYFDGLSAAGQAVEVRFDAGGLRVADGRGRVLLSWPYDRLRAVDEEPLAGLLRLTVADSPARLSLTGEDACRALTSRAPDLHRRGPRWRQTLKVLALCFLGLGLAGAVVWKALPLAAQGAVRLMPRTWDETLGAGAMTDLIRQLTPSDGVAPEFCTETAGARALERLSTKLAAAAESPFDFRPVVLDVPALNAIALPGGRMVLFRELIEFTQTPEELAGVLAHEMAHVIHRDGAQAMVRHLGLGLFVQLIGGGTLSNVGQFLVVQSYSREVESAADREGARLLKAAGIRTDGLKAFLARLGEEGKELPQALSFLSSHPFSAERVGDLPDSGTGQAAMTAGDWAAFKKICGESP